MRNGETLSVGCGTRALRRISHPWPGELYYYYYYYYYYY